MSSGLQRRRVAGSSSGNTDSNDFNEGSSGGSSVPVTRGGYDSEDGRRIAYDPDDINNTIDDLKQPKLTLMEEVLLLGLKDKQVRTSNVNLLFQFLAIFVK